MENDERFARAAADFLEKEEGGTDTSAGDKVDSWEQAAVDLPEVNFYRWRTAVMASLRHRLMLVFSPHVEVS